MQDLASYDEWMRTGRLAQYVTARKAAGEGIAMLETVQPAGDMSDPATTSAALVQVLSNGVRQRSDFGGGRHDWNARAGSFALLPPRFASEIEVFVPHRIRVFSFDAPHFADVMTEARPGRDPFDFGRLHDGIFTLPQLGGVVDRMWSEAADRGAGRLLAESMALQALALLARAADGHAVHARGGLAPWAERRVRDYLHAHYAQNIALAELAGLVGLSPYHFTRMFKHSLGMPPYRYLRRLRVEHAQHMLAASDWPVIEIGAAVGYETPQAFARMFRAETGLSPTQWRRAYRNG
jgi:AraC family transcriptional regulator